MIGLYAGSFDPLTLGHEDIIRRSSKIFDKVVVAVLKNESKNTLFTIDKRVDIVKKSICDLSNVEVITFDGLLVDYVKNNTGMVIIKGLRNTIDFEQELAMSQGIRNLNNEVETLFVPTDAKLAYISSSMVKSVLHYNGDVSGMVNDVVFDVIKNEKEGT